MTEAITPPTPRPRWSGLFVRVFTTFLVTVMLSMFVAGLLAFRFGRAYGPEWFEPIFERIEEDNDVLHRLLRDDHDKFDEHVAGLERELGVRIEVHKNRRPVFHRFHDLPVGMVRRLKRSEPVVIP